MADTVLATTDYTSTFFPLHYQFVPSIAQIKIIQRLRRLHCAVSFRCYCRRYTPLCYVNSCLFILCYTYRVIACSDGIQGHAGFLATAEMATPAVVVMVTFVMATAQAQPRKPEHFKIGFLAPWNASYDDGLRE